MNDRVGQTFSLRVYEPGYADPVPMHYLVVSLEKLDVWDCIVLERGYNVHIGEKELTRYENEGNRIS